MTSPREFKSGGWIPFRRGRFNGADPLGADPELNHLYDFLMEKAAFIKRKVVLAGEAIALERGQLITTRDNLHDDLYVLNHIPASKRPSKSKLWRMLKTLEKLNRISAQNLDNRGTLVTVHELASYDAEQDMTADDLDNHSDDQSRDRWITSEQLMNRQEEREESKEGKSNGAQPHLFEGIEDPKPKRNFGPDIQKINAHYRTYHPKGAKELKPKSTLWNVIKSRLEEGFSIEDCCAAIDGCHKSSFHCGDNPDRRKYQGLDLIFRDSSKVTMFIETSLAPVPANNHASETDAILGGRR